MLFDADCDFCARFAEKVSAFNTAECLQVISFQLHFSFDQSIPLEELAEELHLLSPQKEVFRGGAALQKLFVLFPMFRPFRWMIESGTGKRAGRVAYNTLKRWRSCRGCRIGKR